MSQPAPKATINELYFTGQGDPRHKCVAIGYHRNEPVVYKFDTVDLPQGTRTTVSASRIGSSLGSLSASVSRARALPASPCARPAIGRSLSVPRRCVR